MADTEATRKQVKENDGMVRALLVERAGYLRAGKKDRAEQVDAQLEARGYPVEGLPSGAESKPSRSAPPKGRRAPSTSKAAEGAEAQGD